MAEAAVDSHAAVMEPDPHRMSTQASTQPVDIVIPVYNAPDDLRRCVESVHAQCTGGLLGECRARDAITAEPAVASTGRPSLIVICLLFDADVLRPLSPPPARLPGSKARRDDEKLSHVV